MEAGLVRLPEQVGRRDTEYHSLPCVYMDNRTSPVA
jgi:hypothetical protein